MTVWEGSSIDLADFKYKRGAAPGPGPLWGDIRTGNPLAVHEDGSLTSSVTGVGLAARAN
jgi:hypothetical protein